MPRPFVGFGPGVDPNDPKNVRLRASILVEVGDEVILIDTSPDLREQMLRYIKRPITAVLFTHTHADHCHGIDELRWVCNYVKKEIPVYANAESLEMLQTRFAYCFSPFKGDVYYKPVLHAHEINGPFMVGNIAITPIIQDHGFSTTLGFRIGNFAYSTDVVRLDSTAMHQLQGLDCWVVDALQFDPHPTHAHFEQTIAWINQLQPKRAYLTHLNFNTDYQEYMTRCPPNTQPAIDGLVIHTQ